MDGKERAGTSRVTLESLASAGAWMAVLSLSRTLGGNNRVWG